MQPFALPRYSRPVAIRGHFHQPRYRVVEVGNPFASKWRAFMATLVRVVRP